MGDRGGQREEKELEKGGGRLRKIEENGGGQKKMGRDRGLRGIQGDRER